MTIHFPSIYFVILMRRLAAFHLLLLSLVLFSSHALAVDSQTTETIQEKKNSGGSIVTLESSIKPAAKELKVGPPTNSSENDKQQKKISGNFRGWEYLAQKLYEDNISLRELKNTYGSTRMPRFEHIPYSVNPKESKRIYKSFTQADRLKTARRYLQKYSSTFKKAESHFKVSKYVIAAIIYVETQCGKVTGTELILNRLSRVATIAEPENIKANYRRLLKKGENVTFAEVEERGKYLEKMFYPEVPALFEIARKNQINIFGVKGSYAGAFGIPQFLPSTYLKFGVDANKDGRVSLYQHVDAIWSTANFLSSFGWKPGMTTDQKKKVIWRYNHSDAYVDTILAVADKLKSGK